MARPIFTVAAPRLPRSWTAPFLSQSTACGPNGSGSSALLPHEPENPTACPLSLIRAATPTVSPLEQRKLPGSLRVRLPDDGTVLENLERMTRRTARVDDLRLGCSWDLADVVDIARRRVVAPECRQRRQDPELPARCPACQMGAIAAEVFAVGIAASMLSTCIEIWPHSLIPNAPLLSPPCFRLAMSTARPASQSGVLSAFGRG